VINVSWEDAQAYVAWLSELTGDAYRLPSEAEWEYAARAGAPTRYSWGDDEPVPKSVNYRRVSAPGAVGSYPANPWGLHNMHGNVWEWVEDCWHDSYDAAPNDSGARTSDDCDRRVLRGGASRYYSPGVIRSADRGSGEPRVGANGIGLRVAMIISSSGAEANPRGD
jgi:formylglycine-generating enzyme required for sulfatase activity